MSKARRFSNHKLVAWLRNPPLFGIAYAGTFVLIEGAVAPQTNWGAYTFDGLQIWKTPSYLLLAWFGLASTNAAIASSMSRLGAPRWQAMIVCALLMAALTLLGESLGASLGLWVYNPGHLQLLGVPVWIPASYGLAFAACPWLCLHPIGGAAQAALVGMAWLIASGVLP